MKNILLMENLSNEAWCFDTFKHYIHPTDKVLIIPFSFHNIFNDKETTKEDFDALYLGPNGKYYNGITKGFLAYGIPLENIRILHYFDPNDKKQAKQFVQAADIIYFTGGLPDLMMERLMAFDLLSTLENFSGILMGFSAGAMIQFKQTHITPDKDYSCFSYMTGLNILKGFDIEVHYDQSPIMQESIQKVIQERHIPIYAIGDKGAVIIDQDKKICLGDVHVFKS